MLALFLLKEACGRTSRSGVLVLCWDWLWLQVWPGTVAVVVARVVYIVGTGLFINVAEFRVLLTCEAWWRWWGEAGSRACGLHGIFFCRKLGTVDSVDVYVHNLQSCLQKLFDFIMGETEHPSFS